MANLLQCRSVVLFVTASSALALASGLGLAIHAQQATFVSGTNLVRLEVSVLDSHGEPVRGLTASDFAVTEDNKPQVIATFKAVDTPDVVTTAATKPPAWADTAPRDVATNTVPRRHLLVLVLDDSVTPPDGDLMAAAKEAAGDVIDKMAPGDAASVLFTLNTLNDQDFTSDRYRLYAAVETFAGVNITPSCPDRLDSIGTIEKAADELTAAADQPKALVYITPGMPVDVGIPGGACPVGDRARDAFRAASRTNIAVFPIDVCLLRSPIGPPQGPCADPAPFLKASYMKSVAANTGGEAQVDTNDIKPGIARMFREMSSYYLIGYSPTNTKLDGTERGVDVKMPGRKGLQVLTSRSYYAPDASEAPKGPPPPPSGPPPTLDQLFPNTDVALQMTSVPVKQDRKTAGVAVVLDVFGHAPGAAPNAGEAADIVVKAYSPAGKVVQTSTETVRVPGMPADGGVVHYDALSTIALPPGRYELRASLHSDLLGHDGSVFGDLDVPDFGEAHVAMSGVALSDPHAVPAAPSDALGKMLPLVPMTNRLFTRDAIVSAFFRVYEGGALVLAPVKLHTWVQDQKNKSVIDKTDTIATAEFDPNARSVDHRYELPLSGLSPGDYLLTFEADLGKDSASQSVRFTVH